MSVKDRLRRQERRISGGVTLADDGQPVIFVEGQGYQFNGLFYPDLKALDPGKYQVLAGPPIPFEMFWENEQGLTWPAMLQAMIARGELYRQVEARP